METSSREAVTPLSTLIQQAQVQAERMGKTNPTRDLLRRMSIVLVGLALRVAKLEQQQAEKPRIVLP